MREAAAHNGGALPAEHLLQCRAIQQPLHIALTATEAVIQYTQFCCCDQREKEFVSLHYPLYWHYDILHGLKILAEAGFIDDLRCRPALQLLADKQLPAGGWPAEKKYYKISEELALGNDFVDWGPTGKTRLNPWTTVDALYVFRAAGYLSL